MGMNTMSKNAIKNDIKELIEELDRRAYTEEPVRLSMTGILVGFEHESVTVLQTEKNRKKRLKSLIGKGGDPVGFIKVIHGTDGRVHIWVSPVKKYVNEEWCQKMLDDFAQTIMKLMVMGNQGT